MAYGSRYIFPNDLKPRVAIGVDLPLNGEVAFRSNFQTKDAIKNNLINAFLTDPFERPGNPTFGIGLRRYIFAQITDDNLDFLKEEIQTKITANFPTVILQSIIITPDHDRHNITVAIKYSIVNTNIEDEEIIIKCT